MNIKRLLALILLPLYLASPNAIAHPKTDIVTLYNGDRLTGEIKQLEGGILKLSTDSMGTVNIEWQEIASIDSEFFYEFQLSSGVRHFGSVDDSTRPGQLIVAELGDKKTLSG